MKFRKLTVAAFAFALVVCLFGGLPFGRAGLFDTAITSDITLTAKWTEIVVTPTFTVTIPAKVTLGDEPASEPEYAGKYTGTVTFNIAIT